MVELRMLGTLELVGDGGTAIVSVLAQPRRVALLCYLAVAKPYGYHSRDTILSLFWPELDAAHASHALRQAVYFLRRSTGANIVVSRADGALAMDPAVVACDVRALDQALGEGRLQDALTLYRGNLLPGFHVSEASGFERWLADERVRLHQRAAAAAWSVSRQEEERGDAVAAARWAERAAELSPADELAFRRLLQLLYRIGDRAAALRAYQAFTNTLKSEYDLEPSTETQALVDRIRSGPDPSPAHRPTSEQHTTDAPAAVAFSRIATQRQKQRSGLWLGVTIVLIAAAFYGALLLRRDRAVQAVNRSPGHPVIVVLPFSSRDTNDRDARLAEGLMDDLITKLARGGKLRVVSATSALAFRDMRMDTRALADSLGIANLVEGRLETDGDSFRLNVRLIEARSRGILWSDSYRAVLRQLFSVEDEIVSAIGSRLRVSVGQPAPLPPVSPEFIQAHELFLQAQNPILQRSVAGSRQRLELYERAVAADSTYAAAHAGIAHAYLNSLVTDALRLPPSVLVARADAAAARATALDNTSSLALDALGKVRLAQYRFGPADSLFQRALRLDPANSRIREHIIWLHMFTGRGAEALLDARIAVADDPLSAATTSELARALMINGDCKAALQHLKGLMQLKPPPLRAGPIAAQCYAQQGEWSEAIAALRGPGEQIPFTRALLAFFLARAGRTEEALTIRDSLVASHERGEGGAFAAAVAYAGFRDFGAAFEWLDRAVDDHSLMFSIMEPAFEELRQQPQFGRIATRLGIKHGGKSSK